ncbi:hypothetical protein FQZ97_793240 [compost metagenome]
MGLHGQVVQKHAGAPRHELAARQRGVERVAAGDPGREHPHQGAAGQVGRRQFHRGRRDARAVERGAQQRVGVVGPEHGGHVDLDGLVGLVRAEQLPAELALVVGFDAQALVLDEFGGRLGRGPARKVGRRGHQDGFAGDDLASDHVGIEGRGGAEQGDVVVLDRWLAVVVHLDVELDFGIGLAETGHQWREDVRGQHRRGQDAQHPGEFVRVRAHERVGLVQVLQDLAHPLQVGLTRLGERQAAGGPVQQPGAQVLLQVGHQTGHHRRGDVQGTTGGGKAAFVDHALKNTHGGQSIHGSVSRVLRDHCFCFSNIPKRICLFFYGNGNFKVHPIAAQDLIQRFDAGQTLMCFAAFPAPPTLKGTCHETLLLHRHHPRHRHPVRRSRPGGRPRNGQDPRAGSCRTAGSPAHGQHRGQRRNRRVAQPGVPGPLRRRGGCRGQDPRRSPGRTARSGAHRQHRGQRRNR